MPLENRFLRRTRRSRERGIATFVALFTLLLLSAITIALIYSTNVETGVNNNYRQEGIAYFAGRAGVEEARDRMSPAAGVVGPIVPPAVLPGQPGGVLYLINQGPNPTPVQPWVAGSTYMDDELCHDGYIINGWPLAVLSPGVRCTTLPAGGAWYQTVNSNIPWSGTAQALSYPWVRVAMKENNSVAYGDPAVGGLQNYYTVNGALPLTQPVCYDGVSELVLPIAFPTCALWANAPIPVYAKPVYIITAMGVSVSGARKVVQAEVALTPTPPFPYGLFGTSPACPAVNFSGNNPTTNSYTTAGGGTYATTQTNTGGDVGSNGGVNIGNGNVFGIVGVVSSPGCPNPYQSGPQGTSLGTSCPSNTNPCQTVSFPTPPAPNPLPPNTPYTPPNCGGGKCAVPGTYGNISINGTLTLTPGTYNINSLSMNGNAQIIVNPPGAVTLNVGGTGFGAGSTVVQIAGNGITDDPLPNDFNINYAGTAGIKIAGNGNVTAILDAPNAAITQQGNGNWFGSILGSTIQIGGNAFFHYDRNAGFQPPGNQNYSMLSIREIAY